MYGLDRSYGERLVAAIAALAITVAIGIALTLELLNPARPVRSDRPDMTMVSIRNASDDQPAPDEAAAPPSVKKPALPPQRRVVTAPQPSPAAIVMPAAVPSSLPAPSEAASSGDAAPASTANASENAGAPGQGAAQGSATGGAPNQRAEDRYAMAVYHKVAARIRVTPAMRDGRIYGTARVRLTIDMEGRLIDLSLVASSGDAEIDRMAIAQARSAAPFPRRPKTSSWTQRSFVIPMTYRERRQP